LNQVSIVDDQRVWRCEDGRVGLILRSVDDSTRLLDSQITAMLDGREEARKNHDWAGADKIRDLLKSLHVSLDDRSRTWSCSDGRRGVYRPIGQSDSSASASLLPPAFPMQPFGQPFPFAPPFSPLYGQTPYMMQPSAYTMPYAAPPAAIYGGSGHGEIDDLILVREKLRFSKQYNEADSVRKQLQSMGVTTDDSAKTWSSLDGRSGVIPSWDGLKTIPDKVGSIPIVPTPTRAMMPPFMPPAIPEIALSGYGSGYGFGGMSIDDLITHREKLRFSKQYNEADSVRKQLNSMGVTIDDSAKTWSSLDGRSGVIPTWDGLPGTSSGVGRR
jgi:hypothetical protein